MSLRRTLLAAVAATLFVPTATRAYPIDCAILLCLAGGWPEAAECDAAYAEVIRRITPWPIEPPLQLWRCPMGVALPQEAAPSERLYRVASTDAPVLANNLIASDPAFAFVRALRVYHIRFHERWSERESSCHSRDDTRVGLYSATGDFYWRDFDARQLPGWAPRPDGCAAKRSATRTVRAVAIRWQAHDGATGFEVIRY